MIPERRRACLPPGHWYVIHQPRHGRLVVTLSALVPPNSELEHELVREARRAWKHHERRGLVLLPAPIAGSGLGWLVRQFRRPAVAAGTAVATAGVAFAAVTLTEPPQPAHRPPTAAAPPARPAQTPGHGTTPRQPAKPAPRRPGPAHPRVSHPDVVAAVSTRTVRVDPARLPIRLPVRVPPVHARLPKVPAPPVHVTPPPVVKATSCHLATLELKVVRVCV